jgi:hypothetical protein
MDEDARTLRIEIPSCYATPGAPGVDWNLTLGNGWQATAVSPLSLFWKGTIDLAGYVRDYKTFYPEGGIIQEGPYWQGGGTSAVVTMTIVSTIPIDVENLWRQITSGGGPGFIDNPGFGTTGTLQQNWTPTMFAQSELLVDNNTVSGVTGVLQTLTVKQSGSLAPSAGETLFVVKLVAPFGTIGNELLIPASRVILPGKFGTEPDVEYMMRLKRSSELANQV